MTKDQAVEKLNAIERGDAEAAHGTADSILLQVLADNGLKEVAAAWEEAEDRVGGFWYA